MENMYLFISTLKKYKISPIFVFDGKPPSEKKELLELRKSEKKEAEKQLLLLKERLEQTEMIDKESVLYEMEQLRRKTLKVRTEDIQKVKQLMDAYGIVHYTAPSEADQMCAYLVNSGKAWACMSDDMDMFLYGCPRIIRNLSLMNHTTTLYDTNAILTDLEMSLRDFCEIMVLSGTDYNIDSDTSLKETIRWNYRYKEYLLKQTDHPMTFYVWLIKNTKYIKDYYKLLKTYQLFQYSAYCEIYTQYPWKDTSTLKENVDEVKQIMSKEGFIFQTSVLT